MYYFHPITSRLVVDIGQEPPAKEMGKTWTKATATQKYPVST